MRLTGEDELHGAFRIIDHRGEPLEIFQNQIGAFICGKTTRKAYGEGIRTEHLSERLNGGGGFAATRGLRARTGAHKLNQLRFQTKMRFPQLAIVDIFDTLPDLRLGAVLLPAGAEMAIIETEHLRSEPGRHVDAVGDVTDGNGIFGLTGIEAGPHIARYFAVQGRDGVGATRNLKPEHGHAEIFMIVAGIFATELHQLSNVIALVVRAMARDALRSDRRRSDHGLQAQACGW